MYGERESLASLVLLPYKSYKKYNFQIDGTSRYFGLWLRKLEVRSLNMYSANNLPSTNEKYNYFHDNVTEDI